MIAADFVARSKPDGLTLFLGSNSTMANNVVLFQKMTYDPFKQFVAVSHIGYQPSILMARADAPFKTLKEYVAYAKSNPGKVNRGSVGAGNITNLAGVMLDKAAGINTLHVPYTGDPLVIQAMLGGTIDAYVGSITLALPHVQADKIRVLGVFDDKRLEQLPDVPTLKRAAGTSTPTPGTAWWRPRARRARSSTSSTRRSTRSSRARTWSPEPRRSAWSDAAGRPKT
jgi:tripartite-type tricarboxylate transporter receptor subunit TctC